MSDVPDTMRAFRISRFGGPEQLELQRVTVPRPQRDEVLVRVLGSSVNPVDIKTREGHYPLIREDALPFTLGRDCAGVVAATGDDVAGWKPGQDVYAFIGQGQGTHAEYVVVNQAALARKPSTLDHRLASAVPLAALTAWQGLFEHGMLEAGEKVLIHAGSGGVGHFAAQFAKLSGAKVWVTASGGGVDFVRSLGVDDVIDYKTQHFEDAVCDIDLVYDLVGGQTQERSWSVIRKGGRLVSTLNEPSQIKAGEHGAMALRYTARPDGKTLARIGELLDDGAVRVVVCGQYAFDEVPAALACVERGHVHGKIVVHATL
ncbi:NADPH:quinone reductase and related Zn-dependent oxidoreductase (plasmid) [Paraburkholderia caribensis MBA4]|uniref:NADPH:quinone reductase and related Zn-dependent oxidoreductase n=1 Tax=Paraburkholderia caribensis MBA4 TaxID=1323664 RepID=A0A0P0RRW0_9BURK|nr:NADP-dependent oxidoreductase [Paraburkholderia caribensis]ALL71794.1 NADPH:quinone reductase and related Zn-dependent oxidoreductase [Paraburkholderia caribensis MBA4]